MRGLSAGVRSVVDQRSYLRVVDVGAVIEVRTGVNVRDGLLLDGLVRQFDRPELDLVRVLRNGAKEVLVPNSGLLRLAGVEPDNHEARVLLGQRAAVIGSGEESRHGPFV